MDVLAARQFKAFAVTAVVVLAAAGASIARARPFIDHFTTISTIASAVPTSGPAAGDVNPYGVAVVPDSTGKLVGGDVLVSNFNNAANQQGTGSSIVQISPSGQQSVFAVVPPPTSTPATGLTTALAVFPDGFVVVGSLPAPGGNSSQATAGALTVLNSSGHVVKTITATDINGPWDMTAFQNGNSATLFVTNVLKGTVAGHGSVVNKGTVVRMTLQLVPGSTPVVTSNHVIATGFAEHTDPNALVVGPTGVALGFDGSLYVADSNNNRVAAIPNAMTRRSRLGGGGVTVLSGGALKDPLGLAIDPGGDIVAANGANGNIVKLSPSGRQLDVQQLVPNGGGDLFGIAFAPFGGGMYFVNDAGSGPAANSLQLLH
jgi:hypothetical protein